MPSERRLHPASIVFSIASNARSLVVPLLLVLFAARSSRFEVWLLVLIIPYTLFALIKYLGFRYRLDEDDLVIRTGLVFRNERYIPYTRIHNIESVRNPLHRLLRVAEVRLETAGGAEPEARIQVLSLEAMEEIRRRVWEAKGRQPDAAAEGGGEAAAPPGRTLLRFGPKDLIVYGLIDNRGMVVVGAAMGLAWELSWWERIGGDSIKEMVRGVADLGSPAGYLLQGAAVILIGLLLLRLLSIGWAVLKLYGFELVRHGEEVTTRYGLLTRIDHTIPLRRIQTIWIRQRPLHRLFGRAEVAVETAGSESPEKRGFGRQLLAPLLREQELGSLMREIQAGADPGAVDWRPIDPRAFRRILKRSLIVAILGSIACAAPTRGWGALVFLVAGPLAYLNARQTAKWTAYALVEDVVLFRSGWLWRNLSMARYGKIQAVAMTQSPFDRRYDMANVRVDTAGAGASSHRIHIPYLDLGTARETFDILSGRAARTAFRW